MGVTRRRWDDNGTVPKDEYALFVRLIVSATEMNETILALAKRYPFLFGTESTAALKNYIKQMDKIRSTIGKDV